MALRWAGILQCLLCLAAAHSIPEPSAAVQPPSAADQLSALLGPAVESAVSRALVAERAAQQQCAVDAGQRALGRLEERLDVLSRDVTALQAALAAVQGAATAARGENGRREPSEWPPKPKPETEPELEPEQMEPERRPEMEPEPEREPVCDAQPAALPAGSAAHGAPERRACARSCLQLRNQGGPHHDGVYWFTGMPVPVFCDFSHDGGGWTLLLTAVNKHGWDPFSARARNKKSPSLTDNYSILEQGDAIRNLTAGGRFAYRIEAQVEQGRQRWGGVWFAPRQYSFVDETGSQTEISLVRRFDNWNYNDNGIEQRMPWINTRGNHAMHPVLTTTAPDSKNWWGTLVTNVNYQHLKGSPWISPEATLAGTVLYWMKEDIVNV